MTEGKKKKHLWLYNLIFAVFCITIFLVLWNAPPETTPHLPHDEQHQEFLTLERKQAETHCATCHGEEATPLSLEHPPTYRCLFCHKRD
jgi:cytochrome c553